jgi:hypothetical protein
MGAEQNLIVTIHKSHKCCDFAAIIQTIIVSQVIVIVNMPVCEEAMFS